MLSLSSSVRAIPGIYTRMEVRLLKLGIATVGDLLSHAPFRYEDAATIVPVSRMIAGQHVTVIGTIETIRTIFTKHGKRIQRATLSDASGSVDVIWYNQTFLPHVLPPGSRVAISGTPGFFSRTLVLHSPRYELISSSDTQPPASPPPSLIHTGRIVGIYPETAGISSKWLRTKINSLLSDHTVAIDDSLPDFIHSRYSLVSRKDALRMIHFPKTEEEIANGRRRLGFEELFFFQLAAKLRRMQREHDSAAPRLKPQAFLSQQQRFFSSLPFSLTDAQKRVVTDIWNDFSKPIPMNRLVVGDVGSGKTVVSAAAMYMTFLHGYQSALMVPTEILANQHFDTLSRLFSPHCVRVHLVTGGTLKTRQSPRTPPLSDSLFSDASSHIFVGTHALLSQRVPFSRVGLVVVDEQQRFGVEQRAMLRKKGMSPHVLSLTATPIPRTIALSVYADLDVSILDELPHGRKRTKTWVVPKEKRDRAYQWIRRQITQGGNDPTQSDTGTTPTHPTKQQAFIICPIIEESDSLESVKSAKKEYQRLKTDVFPDLSVALVHGRMKSREKTRVLSDFQNGTYDILVATGVVEVGIDISRATIMLIEGAERFGLAQLHQLRGRVGRGDLQSYCLLFSEQEHPETLTRLKLLETVYNGPALAEEDLKLRGAGHLWGTKQHGASELKFASFSQKALIAESKRAAEDLIRSDPTLSQFPLLRQMIENYTMNIASED